MVWPMYLSCGNCLVDLEVTGVDSKCVRKCPECAGLSVKDRVSTKMRKLEIHPAVLDWKARSRHSLATTNI